MLHTKAIYKFGIKIKSFSHSNLLKLVYHNVITPQLNTFLNEMPLNYKRDTQLQGLHVTLTNLVI